MPIRCAVPFLILPLLAYGSATAQELEVAGSEVARQARKALAALPLYGVFDILTLQVDEKGLVTLGGYVSRAPLQSEAERVIRKVDGVREILNRIEVLPVSSSDDELRTEVYREIYRNSYLSRYTTADTKWLSSRPRTSAWAPGYSRQDPHRSPILGGRPDLGTPPLGEHAIHIIVKNGNVLLAGVVDSLADKNAATIKAGGVFGVKKVDNELQVVPASSR